MNDFLAEQRVAFLREGYRAGERRPRITPQSAHRIARRHLLSAELRRRLSDLGVGLVCGAIAMWFLLDVVAPLIDRLTVGGF